SPVVIRRGRGRLGGGRGCAAGGRGAALCGPFVFGRRTAAPPCEARNTTRKLAPDQRQRRHRDRPNLRRARPPRRPPARPDGITNTDSTRRAIGAREAATRGWFRKALLPPQDAI